ncbi:MAG TPA: hypothetical protein VLG09_01430 [Candidatus Saccharimonadales bacterium]|nr:hypothetical protein [Candidatus Saccharimonadales bacterium]
MNLLTRFGTWLERVTTPPVRLVPCILTDTSVRRTFSLNCRSNFFSAMPWIDLPVFVIEEFVKEFNQSNGDRLYATPYVQYYIGDANTPPSCAGISTFDDTIRATFSLARGKIWPTPESHAGFDGTFLTFTDVRMEFTVGKHTDMVHAATSITIGPEGEIVVD